MGFNKQIKTSYGIDCNYWIVDRVEKSKMSKTAFIILYGYPSKEVKDNGSNFLDRRFINIYPEDYDVVFGLNVLNQQGINDYKNVYEFIKQHFEEFADAIDVLEDET